MLDRRAWIGAAAGWLAGACSAQAVQPSESAPAPQGLARPALAPAAMTPEAVQLLNRLTWGVNEGAAREYMQMGEAAWLASQLQPHWPPTLPALAQAQIDAMTIVRTPMPELARRMSEQRKKGRGESPVVDRKDWADEMRRLAQEASSRSLLRAVYAREQLQDQLGWFWVNHFNVFQGNELRAIIGDYDESLRPHALGRFRDLLGAAVFHPAMLRYLNNNKNALGHINENLGRELLELHTLGVDGGYTQADVQALAAVLTGLGVSLTTHIPPLKPEWQALYMRRGLTEFNPARHDFSEKRLLGEKVAGAGLPEIESVLDRLARHPSTARHISRKLAVYMVGDQPSEALVQKMAERFMASDGRIAEVMRVLVSSVEFRASLGRQFKDPTHFVVSVLRQRHEGAVIQHPQPVLSWLNQLGQAPFHRTTPDGYPMESRAWNGSGQLTMRFEVAASIVEADAKLQRPVGGGGGGRDGAAARSAKSGFVEAALLPRASEATRKAIGQAANPREADALWFSSPEFMLR